jgi:hypothetical protein
MDTNTWRKSKRDEIIKNFIDKKYEKKGGGEIHAISTCDQT